MSSLKAWTALMPEHTRLLQEVRDALIGRLSPSPTPGLVDQVRALQDDMTLLRADVDKLNHGRIDRLEAHDIVAWLRENKKLTTLIVLVLLTIIAPPEVRAILASWLQNGWLALFG